MVNNISEERLICFIYLLGRDCMPLGEIERIMKDVDFIDEPAICSNDYLRQYAHDCVNRLKRDCK